MKRQEISHLIKVGPSKPRGYINSIIAIFILLLLLPLIVVFLLLWLIYAFYSNVLKNIWLGLLVRLLWYPKERFSLFVYSNSPNWGKYIKKNVIPRISAKAIIINWSERSKWRKRTLEQKVFRHWTKSFPYTEKGRKKWGGREFCPVAIVFNPWWNPKVIRFWQAFKDFKHGKDLKLKKCEKELLSLLAKTPKQYIKK